MGALKPLGIDPIMFLAYVINFVVLMLLLKMFLYKPVLNMLKERRDKIEEGLNQANKVRQEANVQQQQFEKELEGARKSSQEAARRQAEVTEKMREQILEEARKEAEQIIQRARQEIEIERQQALSELQRQTADLAIEISKKTVGKSIDEQTQRQLIKQFLAESGDMS